MSGRGAYYRARYGGGRTHGGRRGDEGPKRERPDDSVLGPLFDNFGSIRVPYHKARDIADLAVTLRGLEGAGYGSYRAIESSSWWCMAGEGLVIIDRVQRDAYAPPSRVRVVVSGAKAALPEISYATSSARVATADWVTRRFFEAARQSGDDTRTETGGWGGKKGGEIRIAVPSQFVLERSAAKVSVGGAVEIRFTVALPARGRSIEGRWAAQIMCDRVVALSESSMCCSDESDVQNVREHCDRVLDQQFVRAQLESKGLCCFVADGSVLPRRSGNDDRPMMQGVPFTSAACGPKLRVELDSRRGGRTILGLGLPSRAVSLICGGGFHGKSTLLQALQVGCYDKIPDDGRELVVTLPLTAKIRAEDGRFASAVDISAFLGHLPGSASVNAANFSTLDASGSTSQAAAIAEALEAGCDALLFDEDTCATNFMIRDDRMRQLVADEREPITPLVDRIHDLAHSHGVASVLVVGGTGDYFAVADAIVVMDTFQPRDATDEAKAIAAAAMPMSNSIKPRPPAAYFTPRAPKQPFDPAGRVAARGLKSFLYGDNNEVNLAALEQLVEIGQTGAIPAALATLAKWPHAGLRALLDNLEDHFDRGDLDVLAPAHGGLTGDLVRPRMLEVAAAFNRVRTATFVQVKVCK